MGMSPKVLNLMLVQKLTLRINEVCESSFYATFQPKQAGVSVHASFYFLRRMCESIILRLRGFTSSGS